jgi:hypothetical protein
VVRSWIFLGVEFVFEHLGALEHQIFMAANGPAQYMNLWAKPKCWRKRPKKPRKKHEVAVPTSTRKRYPKQTFLSRRFSNMRLEWLKFSITRPRRSTALANIEAKRRLRLRLVPFRLFGVVGANKTLAQERGLASTLEVATGGSLSILHITFRLHLPLCKRV